MGSSGWCRVGLGIRVRCEEALSTQEQRVAPASTSDNEGAVGTRGPSKAVVGRVPVLERSTRSGAGERETFRVAP